MERGDIAEAMPLLEKNGMSVVRFTIGSLMMTRRVPGAKQGAMRLFTSSDYEPAALNAAILHLRDGVQPPSYNRSAALQALERLKNSPNTGIAYAANTAWNSYATGAETFDAEYPWMRTFVAIAGATGSVKVA